MMYMLLMTLSINPYIFHLNGEKAMGLLIIAIFFTSVLLPLVGILMLRFLGFISSLEMETQTERIGPFIITGVCYIWLFLNLKGNNAVPDAFSMFVLGATISLFLAFFINNFEKISIHAVGMGGMLLAFFIITSIFGQGFMQLTLGDLGSYNVNLFFVAVFLVVITGLVCTARTYLGAHRLIEVAGGLIVGGLGQIIAMRIIF